LDRLRPYLWKQTNLKALVVHPRFSVYGGGEYVCLNVIKALGEMGYAVTLASIDYDREEVEKAFRFGLGNIEGIKFSGFHPWFRRGLAFQRVLWSRRIAADLAKVSSDYDLIFHTQTSYLVGGGIPAFNIFYDPSDMLIIERNLQGYLANGVHRGPYYAMLKRIAGNVASIRSACNIPLSLQLERQLERFGFRHTPYLSAPCDMRFRHDREKKGYVFQMTRMVPQKRLEEFLQIASLLPSTRFVLLGSVSDKERELYPGYAEKIVSLSPENVEYVEDRVWNRPELLEEASIYLYCSHEPGINISTAQAAGAGCIPVAPSQGGGYEIVNGMDIGYVYHSPADAASYIRESLSCPRWSVAEVSSKAQRFSDARFREKIQKIVAPS
jgi:glycosyltransferase involved in cell wall biosynthesis